MFETEIVAIRRCFYTSAKSASLENDSPNFEVEDRMESSRGGPLTTFIMMLPLIIVPAIAMLRPAGQQGSILSDLLSAATGESGQESTADPAAGDEAALFDGFPEELTDSDLDAETSDSDLDAALFAEVTGTESADPFNSQSEPPPPSAADFSAPDFGSPDFSDPGFGASGGGRSVSDADTEQLLGRLKQLGVAKTIWFAPGPDSVGFVAFVPAGTGILSYRFEAVAASKAAAVQDVLQQVTDWHRKQGQ